MEFSIAQSKFFTTALSLLYQMTGSVGGKAIIVYLNDATYTHGPPHQSP